MAQNPSPIKPRVTDARSYEAVLRKSYMRPFVERIQRRLATATGTTDVWRMLDTELEALLATPKAGVPTELIEAQIARVEGYHRQRLIQTFRSALGVDVRMFLTRPAVAAFMAERIGENVDLVKTIPPRFHEGLKQRVGEGFREAPFDQQRLRTMLRDEYQSSGYNLRRLTRDQTNKQVGGLSRLRHGQLGITRFTWRSSQDERVRSTHAGYDGVTYEWAKAPEGGPGAPIQCRCTAEPALGKADLDRLGARASAVTVQKPKPAASAFPAKGKRRTAMPAREEKLIEKSAGDYLQNRIPAAQRDALTGYTRGADRLNVPLRSGRKLPASIQKDVDRVHQAIAGAAKPPPPALAWRGISHDIGNPKVGETMQLDGLISTSVDPAVGASFARGTGLQQTILEIRPKRGVYVKPISSGLFKKEKEFLMRSGSKYRVVGIDEAKVTGNKKYRIVQLEEIDG